MEEWECQKQPEASARADTSRRLVIVIVESGAFALADASG